ncbi:hypothetical protein ASZ78_016426 [Callipepla squamata]|uniref:Uncharacterized protein n=1 Tax=Callipepla squamata TaxID=9009 RepID=A0A226MPP8_CALSU|nr:hypothetical protein ASZ78_016426 [Callipepla squamata]
MRAIQGPTAEISKQGPCHETPVHQTGDMCKPNRNWLGTCQLPLTENAAEIQELCAYLDKEDFTYEPMKDALKCYLKQQVSPESRDYNADWTAEVSVCTLHQIVKVYVGRDWYETYLQTLLKVHAAVDCSEHYIDMWINIKDLKGKQGSKGEKAKPHRVVPRARGTKRKNTAGGYDEASPSTVKSCTHLESSPRKRGMRRVLTKLAENKDSSIYIPKLVPLVVEGGMLNSKGWGFQHVKESDGCVTSSIPRHSAPEEDRGVKAPIACPPGKMSLAIRENEPKLGAEEQQPKQDVSKHSLPVSPSTGMHQLSTMKTTPPMGKSTKNENREPAEGSFPGEGRDKSLQMEPTPRTGGFATEFTLYRFTTEPRDGQQTQALWEAHRNVGVILKVEHSPVIGSDGCHMWNEESIVYSTLLGSIQLEKSKPRALPQDTVFLCFTLSHEEMFYARKCHFFLTDVILDSIRWKDPKEIMANVTTLVHRLWTQQITAKEFVGDLLSTEHFKGDRNVCEQLLEWVEVSSTGHQVML